MNVSASIYSHKQQKQLLWTLLLIEIFLDLLSNYRSQTKYNRFLIFYKNLSES